jgi:Ca-activated chloride channel family protein
LLVVGLILVTGVAMGIAGHDPSDATIDMVDNANGAITVNAHLVQDKVLVNSDGLATLALTLRAPENDLSGNAASPGVDLVVVLDRSGSMNGRKIDDARRAVQGLIEAL